MIVDLDTAVLADELGYDEYLNRGHSYATDGRLMGNDYTETVQSLRNKYYKAPRQYQLHQWLRNEHGLYISVYPLESGWAFDVRSIKQPAPSVTPTYEGFDEFESALEQGLKEALKLI